MREPLPGNLQQPMTVRPKQRAKKRKGRPLPPPPDAPTQGEAVADAPPGKIPIEALFIGEVYTALVNPWLSAAEAAAQALVAGKPVHAPETLVLTQNHMPAWARGIVWNCADRADCKPMQPSNRYTIFEGSRQIDRQAFRDMAAELEWHDHDIVNQVGEGGIEPRSECALHTVLSWHHGGLEKDLEAATKVIREDIGNKWVSEPVSHLAYHPRRENNSR